MTSKKSRIVSVRITNHDYEKAVDMAGKMNVSISELFKIAFKMLAKMDAESVLNNEPRDSETGAEAAAIVVKTDEIETLESTFRAAESCIENVQLAYERAAGEYIDDDSANLVQLAETADRIDDVLVPLTDRIGTLLDELDGSRKIVPDEGGGRRRTAAAATLGIDSKLAACRVTPAEHDEMLSVAADMGMSLSSMLRVAYAALKCSGYRFATEGMPPRMPSDLGVIMLDEFAAVDSDLRRIVSYQERAERALDDAVARLDDGRNPVGAFSDMRMWSRMAYKYCYTLDPLLSEFEESSFLLLRERSDRYSRALDELGEYRSENDPDYY